MKARHLQLTLHTFSFVSHFRYLSPHLAKKTVEVVQEAFPIRFKAFHVLHEPFYFDAILAVLKPFLKDKIRRRVSCAA